MELEDLKNAWEAINQQANKQQKLNPKMIEQMIKISYNSRIKKIAYPEMFGIMICVAGAAFILFSYNRLDTIFLKTTGIVSILLLFTLSAISLVSLRQLRLTGDVSKPYADTLKKFALKKIRFFKLQRLNFTLSYILLVTIIILFTKFFNEKDITANKYFWTFSFSFGYLFVLFYSKWVNRYYKNTMRQTEELLKELIP